MDVVDDIDHESASDSDHGEHNQVDGEFSVDTSDTSEDEDAETAETVPVERVPVPEQLDHRQITKQRRERSWDAIHVKVRSVLAHLEDLDIDLPLLLDALSWRDSKCTQDATIRYARTGLMVSEELPKVLERWWTPPRSKGSSAGRACGANDTMERFAVKCMADIRDRELSAVDQVLRTPSDSFVESYLTTVDLEAMIAKIKCLAPHTWEFLRRTAYTVEQEKRNTMKDPTKVILTSFAMMLYSRNHHYNVLQKLLSIYFKFCGLSERGYDALHALGLVMSTNWTSSSITRISEQEIEALIKDKNIYAWIMSHDNLNIPFEVFSQRLNNQSHFDSGTAATVFVFPYLNQWDPRLAESLRFSRLQPNSRTIQLQDILLLEMKACQKLQPHVTYEILRILLQSPDFDLANYPSRDHNALEQPAAIHALPFGPEMVVRQYMLRTEHIEEASYEGNMKLLRQWIQQMEMASRTEKIRLGLERVIPFIGDQLTCSCLRGLFRLLADELNAHDRLDFLLVIFGWLHLLMAFANSIHKQYLGTDSGRGLQHAFTKLKRKKLSKVNTKGPFHHHLSEALEHILVAHVRVCWMEIANVTSLAELRAKSAEDLARLADVIRKTYLSNEAVHKIDKLPPARQDHRFRQTTLMTRDLMYFQLLTKRGVKNGDVGLMESMLPYLVLRFAGGGNFKYVVEVLELLQGLNFEWPKEVAEMVRTCCWVVNFAGKRDSFLPIDMAQEHNIKAIKHTYRPDGPSNGWDYLRRISPAIPKIRAISEHVNQQLNTLSRGKKHTIPSAEKDVEILVKAYRKDKVHQQKAGRKWTGKDKAADFVSTGIISLQRKRTIERWAEKRALPRANDNDWSTSESESD